VQPRPVTIYDEYVAQTEAPDTIEIRSQVSGLLDRQAFADGERVRKGALLYVIDQRPFESQLAQAKANLAQAEANRINAQQKLARAARLLAAQFVSQQDYDTALAEERATAALVEAQAALVRDARLNLGYATIHAPRDGFMSASRVKPGALITSQQTLLTTLYSSNPMWVYFSISEEKMLRLQSRLARPPAAGSDQAAAFHIRLADGAEYQFPGRLDFVDAAIDERTGTLQVRICVPNPDRILRPGLFVRVTVPAVQDQHAIVVPQQAVQELQGLKSVYVVDASGKAQPKQIVAHNRLGQEWLVESGLAPGDQVVIEGIGKLRPGLAVKPVLAAGGAPPAGPMAPPAGPIRTPATHAPAHASAEG
jgi:membrane fusion protein (multidrug efflux system)